MIVRAGPAAEKRLSDYRPAAESDGLFSGRDVRRSHGGLRRRAGQQRLFGVPMAAVPVWGAGGGELYGGVRRGTGAAVSGHGSPFRVPGESGVSFQ